MPKTSIESNHDLVKAAAYLFSEGKSVSDIGESLRALDPEKRKFTPSTVSKLLSTARNLKFLDDRPRHHLTDEEISHLKGYLNPFSFPDVLQFPRDNVFIYPSIHENSKEIQSLKQCSEKLSRKNETQEIKQQKEVIEGRLRKLEKQKAEEFGLQLANQLRKLLFGELDPSDSSVCQAAACVGLTWGRTLRAIAVALEALQNKNPKALLETRFLPTCGQALGAGIGSREISSSAIAETLSDIFGAEPPESTLYAVPAFIPDRLPTKGRRSSLKKVTDEEHEIIHRFITSAKSYRKIFQGHENQAPLIDSIDTLITSVCTKDNPISITNDEFLQSTGVPPEEFKKEVMGDMGGILFPKNSRNSEFDRFEKMWTGISLEHIKTLAEKSVGSRAPGVVVIAQGSEKAQMVHHVLSLNLANYLFIDSDLAEEIDHLCA